jgi:hypothetical protein
MGETDQNDVYLKVRATEDDGLIANNTKMAKDQYMVK